MSNVKTIILTGEETEVDFGQNFMCFWVQNLGSSDVYASDTVGIVPDSDGVVTIPAGNSARVSAPDLTQINKLYISGSGKVQIVGTYSVHCPFKTAAKGGDDNSGSDSSKLLASIPFNGDIDGYGYTYTFYTMNGASNPTVDENGLHTVLAYTSTSRLIVTVPELSFYNTVLIECDFLIDSVSGETGGISLQNEYVNAAFSTNGIRINSSGTYLPAETGKWHHLKLKYAKTEQAIVLQIDELKILQETTRSYNPTEITFGGLWNASLDIHYKNVQIYGSAEREL